MDYKSILTKKRKGGWLGELCLNPWFAYKPQESDTIINNLVRQVKQNKNRDVCINYFLEKYKKGNRIKEVRIKSKDDVIDLCIRCSIFYGQITALLFFNSDDPEDKIEYDSLAKIIQEM